MTRPPKMRGPWSRGARPRNRFTSIRSSARVSSRFSVLAIPRALAPRGRPGKLLHPAQRPLHRLLPLPVLPLSQAGVHRREPLGVLAPLGFQRREVGPEADREAGGVGEI